MHRRADAAPLDKDRTSFADFDPASHRADVAMYECKSRSKSVEVE